MNISKMMTIKEAAAAWNDPRADFLERWGQMFDLRLEEVSHFHMMKYQMARSQEIAQDIVNVELRALIQLLKHAGITELGSHKLS